MEAQGIHNNQNNFDKRKKLELEDSRFLISKLKLL
jgi:hypothetical protein